MKNAANEIPIPPVAKKADAEFIFETLRNHVAGPVMLQITVDSEGNHIA